MKERPILFTVDMVRALLVGTKTQTRREVKPQPANGWAFERPPVFGRITSPHSKRGKFGVFVRRGVGTDFPEIDLTPCPYGQPGDQLWVRENWRGVVNIAPPGNYEYAVARYIPDPEHCRRVEYAASQAADDEPWRPSIHMPRWASRITLEVTGVRVERLQDISETDAQAEGVDSGAVQSFTRTEGVTRPAGLAYRDLWESINGPGSWDANPWVWVIEFKRIAP